MKDFYPSRYQTISIPSDVDPKQLPVELDLNRTLGKLEISERGTRYEIQEKLTQKGIEFRTLSEAERQKSRALDEILGKVIDPGQNIFTAMAGSFARFGSFNLKYQAVCS